MDATPRLSNHNTHEDTSKAALFLAKGQSNQQTLTFHSSLEMITYSKPPLHKAQLYIIGGLTLEMCAVTGITWCQQSPMLGNQGYILASDILSREVIALSIGPWTSVPITSSPCGTAFERSGKFGVRLDGCRPMITALIDITVPWQCEKARFLVCILIGLIVESMVRGRNIPCTPKSHCPTV